MNPDSSWSSTAPVFDPDWRPDRPWPWPVSPNLRLKQRAYADRVRKPGSNPRVRRTKVLP